MTNFTTYGRGTGRTTRMLEAVAKASHNVESIVVVGKAIDMGRMTDILKDLGANMDNVRFRTEGSVLSARGTLGNNQNVYWDHYAVELHEQRLTHELEKTLDFIRKW